MKQLGSNSAIYMHVCNILSAGDPCWILQDCTALLFQPLMPPVTQ